MDYDEVTFLKGVIERLKESLKEVEAKAEKFELSLISCVEACKRRNKKITELQERVKFLEDTFCR